MTIRLLAAASALVAIAACSSTVSSTSDLRSQGYSQPYQAGYEQGCNAGRQAARTAAPSGASGSAEFVRGYNAGFIACRDRAARKADLGDELARAP